MTSQKKADMISLLPFIPPIYHDFFKNLTRTAPEEEFNTGYLDDDSNELRDLNE